MTKTNMDLSELLAKHDQGDFLRGIAEAVLQLIMETDVEGIIGAGRHERSGERTTWRNGQGPLEFGLQAVYQVRTQRPGGKWRISSTGRPARG
jgi:transposase-like protein